MYIIKSIKYRSNMKLRTDGRYPERIGCTVVLYPLAELTVGECAFLEYVKDNQGNDKSGLLRTSIVTEIEEDGNSLTITTLNSVFELEKVL